MQNFIVNEVHSIDPNKGQGVPLKKMLDLLDATMPHWRRKWFNSRESFQHFIKKIPQIDYLNDGQIERLYAAPVLYICLFLGGRII